MTTAQREALLLLRKKFFFVLKPREEEEHYLQFNLTHDDSSLFFVHNAKIMDSQMF